MKKILLFSLLVLLTVCVYAQRQTIGERILPPAGYVREELPGGSFGQYLRELPLLPEGSKVLLFDGNVKANQAAAYAVVDIDIGNRDLQQCADAVIRLRAEYLYQQKKYKEIHFNFTNGFRADYTKWAAGNRIRVDGNQVSWYVARAEDYTYPTFRAYLDFVFIYAGTASLAKELVKVDYQQLKAGDVFIQGGFPGHAVIVVDVAIHPQTGKKVYLLAQSYMPAQHIHVLTNPANRTLSPWYELEFTATGSVYTPEWTFEKSDLMRFP
ncbi:MAG: DUF4846 domain-containing protein [Bacteroides sp.]|nr:DUF4846 domain-containing protein [Bacteroides sp.]